MIVPCFTLVTPLSFGLAMIFDHKEVAQFLHRSSRYVRPAVR
jgi:hypothetical protein